MKILSIPATYGLSGPVNGGQNRFSNIIKIQKKLGYEILILEPQNFFDERDNSIGKIITFREITFSKWSFAILRDINPNFFKKLFNLIKKEKIDIIEINNIPGAIIIKSVIFLLQKRILIIYSSQNVESNFINEQLKDPHYSLFEKFFLKNATKFLNFIGCKYIVDYIFAVSERDKLIFISKYGVQNKIYVLPSGCNIEILPSPSDKIAIKKYFNLEAKKILIVFHGSFRLQPNAEAIDLIKNYISPIIYSQNPNTLFILAGSHMPKFQKDNIISFGYVENLYRLISIADIAIVPLKRGAGTKLKIFDYFNAGLPIISTTKGMEGIEVKNGIDAIITDDVDNNFINSLISIINNENLRKQLGGNARKLAEEKYNWVTISNDLKKIYNEISFAENLKENKL
jgi:polysaccharide biosynthesis protein PslH